MEVLANMAGSVWKVNVNVGDAVTVGQDIVILESMKMEIPVTIEQDGEIAEVLVNEGDFINEGDVIVRLK